MFSVYFHCNYNRCKKHINTIRANFHLQNIIFPHNNHQWLCIFACSKEESVWHSSKNLHLQRQPTFHCNDDGIIVGKMSVLSYFYHPNLHWLSPFSFHELIIVLTIALIIVLNMACHCCYFWLTWLFLLA